MRLGLRECSKCVSWMGKFEETAFAFRGFGVEGDATRRSADARGDLGSVRMLSAVHLDFRFLGTGLLDGAMVMLCRMGTA